MGQAYVYMKISEYTPSPPPPPPPGMGLGVRKHGLLHVNNKGADQPAHLCSLISTFVVHFLGNIVVKLATNKISMFWLVAVALQAGLSLTWS